MARWLPATVPGNIHADLHRAALLDDPYTPEGSAAARWVEHWDWWLEREIELAVEPGQRAFLHFQAVDYVATFWLDDQLLGSHEGAFAPITFELTPHLSPGGPPRRHRIGVRLWGAAAWPRPAWGRAERLAAPLLRRLHRANGAIRPFHRRLRWLRAPMQAGWDFAPRLLAPGIWESVAVEVTGATRLADWRVGDWHWQGGDASTTLQLTLDSAQPASGTLHAHWEPDNFAGGAGSAHFPLRLRAGQQSLALPLTIPQASRWQPWERGHPALYRLRLHWAEVGSVGAPLEARIGLRELALDGWRLRVNGEPLFARAVNWVPADLLLGTVPHERYARLLGMARERGVNLLRLWGGGGRERRALYDLCDELGLLIWQEFPFACAFLDHYPRDAPFQRLVQAEAGGMVRALRHHPSLAFWGAGNEFSLRRNRRLVAGLAAVVAQEDRRPFVGPSPGPGERHQWHLWHGAAPLHTLDRETAPLVSEVGLQAPPGVASLRRFLPGGALWPPGPAWAARHADVATLHRYAGGAPPTVEAFVAAAQDAQALAVQLAVERQRRRQAEGAAGIALWQWNEPWPAISWALVDWFGEPKAAAEGLQTWYAPRLLALAFERRRCWQRGDRLAATLWAINDGAAPLPNGEARLCQGGQCLWAAPLSMAPFSAQPVAALRVRLIAAAPLELELWQGPTLLACNSYPLALPGPQRAPLRRTVYRSLVEWIMRW